jgi:hypothetical protein
LFKGSNSGITREKEFHVFSDARRDGFGYAEYHVGSGYGFSMTRLSWLAEWVETTPEIRLILLNEGMWMGRQDVLAFQKASPLPSF